MRTLLAGALALALVALVAAPNDPPGHDPAGITDTVSPGDPGTLATLPTMDVAPVAMALPAQVRPSPVVASIEFDGTDQRIGEPMTCLKPAGLDFAPYVLNRRADMTPRLSSLQPFDSGHLRIHRIGSAIESGSRGVAPRG